MQNPTDLTDLCVLCLLLSEKFQDSIACVRTGCVSLRILLSRLVSWVDFLPFTPLTYIDEALG